MFFITVFNSLDHEDKLPYPFEEGSLRTIGFDDSFEYVHNVVLENRFDIAEHGYYGWCAIEEFLEGMYSDHAGTLIFKYDRENGKFEKFEFDPPYDGWSVLDIG